MKKKLKLALWLSALGALLAVILLNLIVGKIGEKTPLKLDLTSNKIFELSEETKNVLKNVDKDIDVFYFVTKGNEELYIAQTIEMYKGYSDKIHFEQKDPTADPVFARSLGTDVTDNSVIVKSGDRIKVVDSSTIYDDSLNQYGIIEFQLEQKLTRAIAYVQAESDIKVYFTSGHEEIGYQFMKTALEDENAEAYEIDLKTTDIPTNAAAIYIIGPQTDFSADELSRLQSYLSNGGGLNVSLDVKADDLPTLRQFLSENWGINYNNDIVMETDGMSILANNPFYLLPQIAQHDITSVFVGIKPDIAWPESRSLYITEVPDVKASSLLTTTENAFSKAAADSVSYTAEEGDIQGVQTLAVAFECVDNSKNTTSRIIATGTSLYAADMFLSDTSFANSEFLRKCFLYLRGEDSKSVAIIPKNVAKKYMVLKLEEIIGYACLFVILPVVLVLAAGLIIWLRRRRL